MSLYNPTGVLPLLIGFNTGTVALVANSTAFVSATEYWNNSETGSINTLATWTSSNTSSFTVKTGSIVWVSGAIGGLTGYVSASFLNITGVLPVVVYSPVYRPLIPESGTVKFHTLVTGSALVDNVFGNTWAMVGTVPYNTASAPFPESFGPTAVGNYFTSGTGAGTSADFTGSTTLGIIFKKPTTGADRQLVFNMDTTDTKGWLAYYENSTNSVTLYVNTSGGAKIVRSVCSTGTNGIVAWVGGWNNTDGFIYSRCNESALSSTIQSGGPIYGGTRTLALGRSTDGGPGIFTGYIAECYMSDQAPTSATLTALYQAMSASLSGGVP